jgi:hypothetical protein
MPNEELSWVEDKEKGKWNLKVNFIFNISKVQVLMDDHLERKKKKKFSWMIIIFPEECTPLEDDTLSISTK